MILTLFHHKLTSIRLGSSTAWQQGCLTVSPQDVERLFPFDANLQLEKVTVAMPGESLRMGPVMDVTGMRCCIGGAAFPGVTGKAPASSGSEVRTLHLLDRGAVSIVANMPDIQDGLIDMTAAECPFSSMCHCVCIVRVGKGADREKVDALLRAFQCRLAEFLAGHAVHAQASSVEELVWPLPPAPDLPKVGMVYLVQSQGAMRRTWLEGQALDAAAPREISPLLPLYGGIVSGNYVLCCNKTCTYIHQEQPVIRQILARHGASLNFCGVILAIEPSTAQAKADMAAASAALAAGLGWQGAIVNQEGGGNADTDAMLVCKALEQVGIATTLLLNEFAGDDGRTPSLAETTPEAQYIVSTGNNDFLLSLPEVARCEGFLEALLGAGPARAITVPLTRVYASTNQLGFHTLSCETR